MRPAPILSLVLPLMVSLAIPAVLVSPEASFAARKKEEKDSDKPKDDFSKVKGPKELVAFLKKPSEKTLERLKKACKRKGGAYLPDGEIEEAIERIKVRSEDLDVDALFYLDENCTDGAAGETVGIARRATVLRNASAVIRKLTEQKHPVSDWELEHYADIAKYDEAFMSGSSIKEKLESAAANVEAAKAKGKGIQIRARLHIMIRDAAKKEK